MSDPETAGIIFIDENGEGAGRAACLDRRSIWSRQEATAGGSMVSAKPKAIRPSYGRPGSVAMRPEATLPSMGWDGSGSPYVASPFSLYTRDAEHAPTTLAVLDR